MAYLVREAPSTNSMAKKGAPSVERQPASASIWSSFALTHRWTLETRSRPDTAPSPAMGLSARADLGTALGAAGKLDEAETVLLALYEESRKDPETPASRRRALQDRIAKMYADWGKGEKAAEWKGRMDTGG